MDRGPYGKDKKGGYKAIVDLSLAVQKAINHNGYEPVYLTYKERRPNS